MESQFLQNDIDSDNQRTDCYTETNLVDESRKIKEAVGESSCESYVDNAAVTDGKKKSQLKFKKKKKRKRKNEQKEEKKEKITHEDGTQSAVTEVNFDGPQRSYSATLSALKKEKLEGTKTSITAGSTNIENEFRLNSTQVKHDANVDNENNALTSLEIFCVKKDFNRSTQSEIKVSTISAVKNDPDKVKKRKKKKRLPDIKKRSSKVAITNDKVLPPILSTSLPVTSPRDQCIGKDEKSINFSELNVSTKCKEENQEEKREHKEPLWICKLFYRFPITSFGNFSFILPIRFLFPHSYRLSCIRISKHHSSVCNVADLRTGGRWFDPRLGQNSFWGLTIVISTGFIPLSPVCVVSTMVLWKSSQWHGKNIVRSTG